MFQHSGKVGQEGQEFKASQGYTGDLRLFCSKKEPISKKLKHSSDNDEYCYCY